MAEGSPQPIIEQTSSSEHHYELMALAGILSEIRGDLQVIRTLTEQSFASTETLRQEAQQVLDAHAQSAQEYLRHIDEPVPVDYYPFTSMPAGTTVRNLPDGGRLFGFTNGAFLRVFPDGTMSHIDEAGEPTLITPPVGGKVTLPGGRELPLISDAVKVTHEGAGIEGLPDGVEPTLASPGRYTVLLPDGTRIDVYHRERAVAIINPSGTIDVLGISRVYGIGEEVQSRSISGGAKSFRALESGHAGMIAVDGTIHLSLSNGLDLVIRFPEATPGGDDATSGAVCFNCVEPD
ncbi:MAG: hypothetical protein M1133_01310 [Armatimonadetes bacterium]|nr:hypothetical protein [Armatimonadota bacterium]